MSSPGDATRAPARFNSRSLLREDALSTSQLKIYGILSNQETHRHDIDLLRQRTIQRIFVAAKNPRNPILIHKFMQTHYRKP